MCYSIRFRAKIRLDLLILSSSVGKKPQCLPFFGPRHLVMSTVGGNLRKLNTDAQLQTFPYPTASKSFLYSNAFMAKSGAQRLTFKSVTNRQTNRRTDRQTLNVFGRPEIRALPNWQGDRGPQARSCVSKTFGGLTHNFNLKPRNSITP